MSLLLSLRSELLKTKRTAPFYLTLGAAAFAPFMSMLDLLLDGVDGDHKLDIFNEMLTTKFQMTGLVALPIFLILVCTLLPQVEYKNNTWKQVLTSPQHKGNVFAAKFLNLQMFIGLFLLANMVFMLLAAIIFHFMEPSLKVLNQPLNWNHIISARVNIYLALLAMCTIQFWLGLRCKNFIIPIAIGIALWFAGTILVMQTKSGFVEYFPYSFHAYGSFPKYNPQANLVGGTSVIYAVIFIVLGYIDFNKRSMKG